MNFFKQTIAAVAIATGLCVPAFADTMLNVHYPMLAAVNLIGRMVKEGGIPVLTKQAVEQAFVADKVGISLLRDDC